MVNVDKYITLHGLFGIRIPITMESRPAGVYGSHGSIAPRTSSLAKFAQVCVPGVAEVLPGIRWRISRIESMDGGISRYGLNRGSIPEKFREIQVGMIII